eukprot:2074377-Alexandrium_andersonii.AAC.1
MPARAMDPDGRGDDRSRSHTQRGPPAQLEAPDTRTGKRGPECGLGTRANPSVFCSMSRVYTSGPGELAHVHADRRQMKPDQHP